MSRTAASPALPSTPRQPWLRLGMLLGVVAFALAAAGLCVAWLVPRHSGPTFATYPLADLEVGRPQFFRPFNMGYDRNNSGRGLGIWLVRREDGGVDAFYSGDTHHRGATELANFQGTSGFREPPHDAFFALNGQRLYGPAPRGLDGFRTEVVGESVRIETSRLVLGACGGTVYSGCSPLEGARTKRVNWPDLD